MATYSNDPDTVETRVKGIVRVKSVADLTEPIAAGLVLVKGALEPAGYSQEDMQTIHCWLAAHFYEIDFQRKFRQKIGKSEEYPETKVDLGLNLTRPGQQVLVLDWKHALAGQSSDNQSLRPARMFWAGNPREAH